VEETVISIKIEVEAKYTGLLARDVVKREAHRAEDCPGNSGYQKRLLDMVN
jgi:hypothetical protein